jgi:hypothetical protein
MTTVPPSRPALSARLASDLSGFAGLAGLSAPPASRALGTSVVGRLADRLRSLGCEPDLPAQEGGAPNLVLRIAPAGGRQGPALVFLCPADDAELQAALAAQCWVAEEVWRRGGPACGSLTLAAVSDGAALGSAGTGFLRASGVLAPDLLVFAARTENQLATSGRTVLRARIVATGRGAPAGNPDAGDNAILRMLRVLDRIDLELGARLSLRRDGATASTLNIGVVEGGASAASVPDLCRAELERHLLDAEDPQEALEELRDIVEGGDEPPGSVRLDPVALCPAFRADEDGVLAQAFRRVVLAHRRAPLRSMAPLGTSEGRWFAGEGVDLAGFGPGAPAGGPVPLDQAVDAALIQLALVRELLGLADEVR